MIGHNEFVVEYKDGTRDWIDPVLDIYEDDSIIYVANGHALYEFSKQEIDKWVVRPYTYETTHNKIGE